MVAMSGGVDSSVSALLLQQQGLDIAGMFMKNWEEDDRFGECSAAEDVADAEAVAESMGMVLHTRNFASEYWENVLRSFSVNTVRAGHPTLISCVTVKSNSKLSWNMLKNSVLKKLPPDITCAPTVKMANTAYCGVVDHNKDQSYFLYAVGHQQLAKTLFPVGELEKPKGCVNWQNRPVLTCLIKRTAPVSVLSASVTSQLFWVNTCPHSPEKSRPQKARLSPNTRD